jgi:hypothetical protein
MRVASLGWHGQIDSECQFGHDVFVNGGPTKLRRTEYGEWSLDETFCRPCRPCPQMTVETTPVADMAVPLPLHLQPSLGGSSTRVDWLDYLQRPATRCVYAPPKRQNVKGAALKSTDGYSVSVSRILNMVIDRQSRPRSDMSFPRVFEISS